MCLWPCGKGDFFMSDFLPDSPTDHQPATEACPDCGGPIHTDGSEQYCRVCGLIIEDQPITTEIRALYDHSGPQSSTTQRAKQPTAAHREQTLTEIGRDFDATGSPLDSRKRKRLVRLRREQRRAYYQSEQERSRTIATREIDRLAGALGLTTDTRDQAIDLFDRAQSEQFVNGRSVESVAAACMYATCRLNKISRLFDEVARATSVPKQDAQTVYSSLVRDLSLPIPPRHPQNLIPRLATGLGISIETESAATELAAQLDNSSAFTDPAVSLAAACISLATSPSADDTEIAALASISARTIRRVRSQIDESDQIHHPALDE